LCSPTEECIPERLKEEVFSKDPYIFKIIKESNFTPFTIAFLVTAL